MKYDYTDLALTEDGDLSISFGDFMLLGKLDQLKQAAEFRLHTDLRDMYIHPGLGNVLRGLVGERNTKNVAERGKASIISALTYDGLIDSQDITVIAIPANQSTILFHVEISIETRVAYRFDLMCDLENGIRRI